MRNRAMATRFLAIALAAGAATSAAGCFPAVAHGPRVEPGVRAQATIAVPMANDLADEAAPPFTIPAMGIGPAYGQPATAARPGFRVSTTFQIPAGISPDLYVQLPRGWLRGIDGGFGYSLSSPGNSTLPYVQLGRINTERRGAYTTIGFVNQADYLGPLGIKGSGWLLGIAYQIPVRRETYHLFATGIAGRRYPADCSQQPQVDCASLAPARVLHLGVAWEEKFSWPLIVLK